MEERKKRPRIPKEELKERRKKADKEKKEIWKAEKKAREQKEAQAKKDYMRNIQAYLNIDTCN